MESDDRGLPDKKRKRTKYSGSCNGQGNRPSFRRIFPIFDRKDVTKLFSGLTDHLALMDYIKKHIDLPEILGASVVNLRVRAVS